MTQLSELQRAYVPLGTFADQAWTPLGGGVLVVDMPVAWLVTAASLLDRTEQRPLAARLWGPEQAVLVDLSRAHRENGLAWLRHERLDLAACLFPLQSDQSVRGFTPTQVAGPDLLQPPALTSSLGCPPGQIVPIVLAGNLADVQAGTGVLLTSSPLLGESVGGPLLVTGGLSGQPLLAGILTRSVILPEADPRLPPLRMAEAVPAHVALALIRSAEGREQRARALGQRGGDA